ncbi:MAG: TIGR02678 family protein [Opitutaceae bacterium]|nr:TIGR02678 family protein [Opitutaceae bacterium]
MSTLPPESAEIERLSSEERQAALRALLRRPLLIADHPDHRADFAKVRRHAEPLRSWFARQTGWTLDVTTECARLYKVPARLSDATHPARLSRDELPLTRTRYVLLCLSLAILVRGGNQTTLGQLAQAIVSAWNDDSAFASLTFDLDAADSRRDLIAAIRLLLDLHALTQVDGDEQRFLHDRTQEVLYDVNHHILFRLLATRRPPSSLVEPDWDARLAALVAEPVIDEEEQRNQRIRHFIARRLLDDPVIYPATDLPRDAQDYLLKQRPHLLQMLTDATDLEPEDRRDGLALADKFGDCTDIGLPEEGTDGHATLLTAEHLGRLRLASPGDIIPFALIDSFLAEQAQANRTFWRKDATLSGAERQLARSVVARLASLDLVRVLPDGIIVMPAIHRYRHELRAVAEPAPDSSISL